MRENRKNLSIKQIKIAKERIKILLNLAEKELNSHPERSRKYIELARNIGKRCNVRLTKEQKGRFCKECNQLLIPEKTSQIKLDRQKKFMEIKCMNCGSVYKHRC
jgi:ribonuclease P protein subunit RPR2